MITDRQAAPAAAQLPTHAVRLATRITEPVDRRLRLAALVRKMPVSRFLDHLLDEALPAVAELADQIQEGAPDEH